MKKGSEVKLYDADTLEYAGSMIVKGEKWEYKNIDNDFLVQVTSAMPVKGVLASLINFNLVYDIIPEE